MDETAKKTGPREIFPHLLAIIGLYVSAGSFIALLFQYVNVYFPDPLEQYGPGTDVAFSNIRFAMSALIVVFPVYLLTTRHLNKVYEHRPEVRVMRTRKWLTYFTLFAAALIIIGDLVTLINHLLGGELTVRFILKVLTVFFVAGSVFYYYFSEIKKIKTE